MKQYIERLQKLAEIDSYTLNVEGVNAMGNIVREMLEPCGFTWQSFDSPSGEYGKMHFGSTAPVSNGKNVLLCGHLDTVHSNFSECKIGVEGDKLYGPGTVDMKGGLVVMIESLLDLAKNGPLKGINVILMPEEEMMHIDNFPQIKEVTNHIDKLLVFEGQGCAPSKPDDFRLQSLVVKRRGGMSVEFTATAEGGHSGILRTPELRHSAIHELVQHAQVHITSPDYANDITTNVGQISGGTADNVLAQSAQMVFEVRVQQPSDFERWHKKLLDLPNHPFDEKVKISARVKSLFYPMDYTQGNREFYNYIVQALGEKYPIVEEFRGGASDANRILYFNPGIAAIDNLGPVGQGEHTTEEFVYIESLEPKVEFCKDLLSTLSK